MTEEQREFIFRHPWYLKLFSVDDRVKIISSYTKEESWKKAERLAEVAGRVNGAEMEFIRE